MQYPTDSTNQNLQNPSNTAKSWVYINGLGEKNLNQVADSDVLSAIRFNDNGDYLAVGD